MKPSFCVMHERVKKCVCAEGAYRSERFRHGAGKSCGRGSWEEAPHLHLRALSEGRLAPRTGMSHGPAQAEVWEEQNTPPQPAVQVDGSLQS